MKERLEIVAINVEILGKNVSKFFTIGIFGGQGGANSKDGVKDILNTFFESIKPLEILYGRPSSKFTNYQEESSKPPIPSVDSPIMSIWKYRKLGKPEAIYCKL